LIIGSPRLIAALRETVNTWLSKAVIGFKEQSFNKLDRALIDISKKKDEVVNALAEKSIQIR
jgi:hypothetical protein